ncbi:uncharacterized protein LOC122756616 [Drosophila santomea]|uniref:uncharacterized protein LOC122756616 n=1 Tax=Drosophila santomea TaxID=129105 RepID=UPI001CCE7C16|nr:uncharacterized protein LOC122756616 [Drosophila santomea]
MNPSMLKFQGSTSLLRLSPVEDVPVKRVRESTSICEENFVQSTKRNEDGRSIALAQFLRNEIRLNKDVASKKQYDSVIQEYLDLGHMHQVSPDDSNNFYLPHHAVFKPDSTTTKVRVVFNASNPSSNGNSLNDILHAGPVLQSDLTIQILKWRFFKYVFNADITKMYRQIRLAQDIRGQYPLASDIISNFMYVDDVLAGTHTKQSAVLAIEELRLALESAGFPLRKWTSNERKLLQEDPKEHLISADFLELEEASTAKTLRQRIKIWLRELGWDQPLPRDLATQWREFLEGYPALKEIRIPRWVRFHPAAKLQYHAFCDASQDAYGAAIFVRIETKEGCCTHLLTSKTRVAPVRSISIPRLELCGAVLLTELAALVISEVPPYDYETFYWTDSTIVLAWLNNPADLASRGVSPQELKDSALWWRGPAWLHLKQEQWPSELLVHPETELEQRPVKCHTVAVPSAVEILERFSAFDRALRVLAYVFRFVKSCRREGVASSAELTAAELSEVQERLIVLTQKNEFPAEYKVLSNKQQVPPASAISNLNPFLDGNGVLRASGRLQASEMLSYDEKHPIILPARCRFAELQVLFIHRISLHGGNQLMIRLIRSKFWIPKLKMLVKRVCVIHKKRLQTQLMGNLPRARSTFSRPFTHTGVDFAGPFDVKSYVGRACKITKGEVLGRILPVFARRGCPQHVYSDNGKTFVGASTSLSKDFIEATRTSVLSQHSLQNVSWHFNPPGAPHMGGLWEAGVKSFKSHFYKYTAAGKYTFEELTTLLAKIEACLNSRPISPMSEDPTDLIALSPGHFLIGGPLLAVAEPEVKEGPSSIINRWRRLKALNQQFCLRWKEEYLKELHKRNKWKFPTRDLQAGDMVVIKEENLPSNEWRLGRIQVVCPGVDGKVVSSYVVHVRIYNGSSDPPRCIPLSSVQGGSPIEELPAIPATAGCEAATALTVWPTSIRVGRVAANRGAASAERPTTLCCTSAASSQALRGLNGSVSHKQRLSLNGVRNSLSTPTGAPSLVRTSVSILPTAAVLIGSEQKRFDVRVVVDPCCPVSRIHVSLVKALNLAVTGVGNERLCTTEIRSKTSRMSKQLLMVVDEQMQSRTPAQPLDPKVQDMFHNMTLADDRWFHPALVSAVLGADVYADLMLPGIIASQDGLPMAQNSKLRWILSGRCSLS